MQLERDAARKSHFASRVERLFNDVPYSIAKLPEHVTQDECAAKLPVASGLSSRHLQNLARKDTLCR